MNTTDLRANAAVLVIASTFNPRFTIIVTLDRLVRGSGIVLQRMAEAEAESAMTNMAEVGRVLTAQAHSPDTHRALEFVSEWLGTLR
jgi:hypothetical protein